MTGLRAVNELGCPVMPGSFTDVSPQSYKGRSCETGGGYRNLKKQRRIHLFKVIRFTLNVNKTVPFIEKKEGFLTVYMSTLTY